MSAGRNTDMVGERRFDKYSIRQRQKNWLGMCWGLTLSFVQISRSQHFLKVKSEKRRVLILSYYCALIGNVKSLRGDANTARWLYWGGAKKFRPPHLPCILCRAERVSLQVGIGAGVKKLECRGLPGREKVWRYLQPCGYNGPTWQTDTGRQQKPRLRIASRGKNSTTMSSSTLPLYL